nr:hypothetical protein [Tanacetum cinerariifolium]
PEEVGEIPTDTQDAPILTQPSSSQPQRKHKSRKKQREAIEVLNLEKAKTAQAKEIANLKKRVKKLERKKKSRTSGLKRLYKVGLSARIVSPNKEDATTGEIVEQDTTVAEKEVSTAADEVVTTAKSIEEIKAAKPRARGVIFQEPNEFRTTLSLQSSQLPQAKDKGKGIMVEHEKPLKKKDQIAFDEEVARNLNAKMKAKIKEEERITREKNEANKAVIKEWDDGYKQKEFKGKSFDAIKKMFDKVYKRVNTFVAMDLKGMEGSKKTQAEVTKVSSKRAGDEKEQESAKKQKLDEKDIYLHEVSGYIPLMKTNTLIKKLEDSKAPEEVGEIPTDTQDAPILTQPSSSQPQRKHKSRKKQREAIEVLDLEKAKTAQAKEIDDLKKRVKKLKRKKKSRTSGLKRLYKVGLSARIVSPDKEDVTTGEIVEQDTTVAEKEVSTAADEVVTTAESTDEIKADKPRARGIIFQEPNEFRTTLSLQLSQLPQAKDKGKGIMVEPEKPLKKKDQIAFDEEVARNLNAKMKAKIEEEERITREKNEANRAVIEEWDDVHAIIDADRQLA